MIRKTLAVLLSAIAFNLLFFSSLGGHTNSFVIPFPGTIGFLGFVVLAQAVLFFAVKNGTPRRNYTLAVASSGLAILAAFLAIYRGSFIDIFLLSVTAFGLSLISTYLLILDHKFVGAVTEFIFMPIVLFFSWLTGLAKVLDGVPIFIKKLANILQGRRTPVEGEKLRAFSRGIILAIPVVLLVVILLSSADPAFSRVITDMFSIKLPEIPQWLTARLIATSAFLLFVLPFVVARISQKFRSPFNESSLSKIHIEVSVIVGGLALVFALFLLVQYKYLFTKVAETELIQFGVNTYSEYVRRGFGELVIVSVIVYLVVGGSLVVFRNSEVKQKLLGTLNLILLSETVIFILSILRRVYLYQLNHGLTRIRVYGSGFLILLLALTVILILRHVRQKRDWYLYELASLIAVVFIFTNINVDRLIANSYPPTVNGEKDYVYISKLSTDAVDGWIEAYQHAKKDVEEITKSGDLVVNRRNAVYAEWTLLSLENNYEDLIRKYGTEEEKKATGIVFATPGYDGKHVSFNERDAYKRLTLAVNFKELIDLRIRISQFVYSIPVEQRYMNLDRSIDTPLVR